jgi:hypothetical protein
MAFSLLDLFDFSDDRSVSIGKILSDIKSSVQTKTPASFIVAEHSPERCQKTGSAIISVEIYMQAGKVSFALKDHRIITSRP